MVSGHWETAAVHCLLGRRARDGLRLLRLSRRAYRISYPAPGSPELAARVQGLLQDGGVDCGSDRRARIRPRDLQPDEAALSGRRPAGGAAGDEGRPRPGSPHPAGRLLAPLRDDGVLILGSGSSYHNLRRWDASALAPSRGSTAGCRRRWRCSSPAERLDRLVELDQRARRPRRPSPRGPSAAADDGRGRGRGRGRRLHLPSGRLHGRLVGVELPLRRNVGANATARNNQGPQGFFLDTVGRRRSER